MKSDDPEDLNDPEDKEEFDLKKTTETKIDFQERKKSMIEVECTLLLDEASLENIRDIEFEVNGESHAGLEIQLEGNIVVACDDIEQRDFVSKQIEKAIRKQMMKVVKEGNN